jgi:GNAT superfamily N-acetyltransferase
MGRIERFLYLQARRLQYGLQRARAYYRPLGPSLLRGMKSADITVRTVREEDLVWLERFFPAGGRAKHRERFEMQLDGAAEYLIAWHLVPVGHLLLMWDGCPDEPITGMQEIEPFIEDFFVLPAARRKGVGNALMKAAEDMIRERGYERAALTNSINNPLSMIVHLKRGWRKAGIEPFEAHRTFTDERGSKREWSARVEYLVKDLRRAQDED